MNVVKRGMVLAVLLAAMSGAMVAPAGRADSQTVPASEVMGRASWGATLACAACVAGGAAIAAGGFAAIFMAVHAPGSAVILGACIGSCAEALS